MSSKTIAGRSAAIATSAASPARRFADDVETDGLEQRPRRGPKPLVVVDDQHGLSHHAIVAQPARLDIGASTRVPAAATGEPAPMRPTRAGRTIGSTPIQGGVRCAHEQTLDDPRHCRRARAAACGSDPATSDTMHAADAPTAAATTATRSRRQRPTTGINRPATHGATAARTPPRAFNLPFDLTVPTWLDTTPSIEQPNFVTWEASDTDRAVRFLIPVNVYPPGRTATTPPPNDYVAYLLAKPTTAPTSPTRPRQPSTGDRRRS